MLFCFAKKKYNASIMAYFIANMESMSKFNYIEKNILKINVFG